MQNVKKVSSAAPYFDQESINLILSEIQSTLKSGILTLGPRTEEFENKFADYIHTKYAIAVSSATAALEIMLRIHKIEGKEVLVPTNTFVATPTSVLLSGGKPVFADMNKDTLGIDVEDVERKISSKTAGVIVVHIAGLICPQMNELRKLCEERGLFLLEDDAHAHGAMIDGKMAGNLCAGGAFSFYPTKVMTSGQGGMITTNDPEVADIARKMRDHGLDAERKMIMMGDNWCMSEITAVVGKYQLSKIEEFVAKRNEIAQFYKNKLMYVDGIKLFETPANIRHSYYKFPIRLADGLNRDSISKTLKESFGIETGSIYYPPCHLHPWFKDNYRSNYGELPVSEKVLNQVLCLPIHGHISEETAQYVVDSLVSAIKETEATQMLVLQKTSQKISIFK